MWSWCRGPGSAVAATWRLRTPRFTDPRLVGDMGRMQSSGVPHLQPTVFEHRREGLIIVIKPTAALLRTLLKFDVECSDRQLKCLHGVDSVHCHISTQIPEPNFVWAVPIFARGLRTPELYEDLDSGAADAEFEATFSDHVHACFLLTVKLRSRPKAPQTVHGTVRGLLGGANVKYDHASPEMLRTSSR